MPITEKELLSGFLSKTLNMDTAGVAALYNADGTELNDNALETLLTADALRVSKVKPDTKKFFDDGYKKAQSEVASKKEKAISEAVGFDTDLKGEEFDAALAEFVSSKVVAGKEITEDVVKQHPIFKSREKELQKQLKEANEKAVADVEKVTKEYSQKEVKSKIRKTALTKTLEKKPLLNADKSKAERQLEKLLFDDLLNGYEFPSLDDNDVPTEVWKDGKRLEDKHGNALTFDDLLNKISTDNGMEFEAHVDKESANAGGNTNPPPGKKPIVVPKNQQEYDAFLANKEIPAADKQPVIKEWMQKATT